MLKWLCTGLFVVAALCFHLWLYLFVSLSFWQYVLLLCLEALPALLLWRGRALFSLLKTMAAGLWRMPAMLLAPLMRRGYGMGQRVLCYWRLRWVWWRLTRGANLRGRSWLWLISPGGDRTLLDRDIQAQGRCLRAIGNPLLQLRLWEWQGMLILEQGARVSSPLSGHDNVAATAMTGMMDRLAATALDHGRCAAVICNIHHTGHGDGPWSMDTESLRQDWQDCRRRLSAQGGFIRHVPVALLIDHEACREDLQQLLTAGEKQRSLSLYCRAGAAATLDGATAMPTLSLLRHQLLDTLTGPAARISALRLPGRFQALLAALDPGTASHEPQQSLHLVALPISAAAGVPTDHQLSQGPVAAAGLADWQTLLSGLCAADAADAAAQCRSIAARSAWLARSLRRGTQLLLLLTTCLCLMFVNRVLLLSDEAAMPQAAADASEIPGILQRRIRRMEMRLHVDWLPLPGESGIRQLQQVWTNRYLRLLDEALTGRSIAPTSLGDGAGYARLLQSLTYWIINGSDNEAARQRDLRSVVQERCRIGFDSGLCRQPQLLEDYRRWRGGVPAAVTSTPGVTTTEIGPYLLPDTWFALFAEMSPMKSPQPLCTSSALHRADGLLAILQRHVPLATGNWTRLRQDIATRCQRHWQIYLREAAQQCDEHPDATRQSPLAQAAAALGVLDRFAGADPQNGVLQQVHMLETLPAALTAVGAPGAGTDLRRGGLNLIARLQHRWQQGLPGSGADPEPARALQTDLTQAGPGAVSAIYLDYLRAMRELQQGLTDSARSLELARLTLSTTDPPHDGPVHAAWRAAVRLQQLVAGDAWNEIIAVLMQCRTSALWRRTLAQAGREIRRHWRETTNVAVVGDRVQRLVDFYGPEGRLATFTREQLREFVDFSARADDVRIRKRYEQGLALTTNYLTALRALRRLGSALSVTHRIGVVLRPLSARPGTGRQPHRLDLQLDCQESQLLQGGNYRSRGMLHWQLQQCTGLQLRIHLGSSVLQRSYTGSLGILGFVADFADGSQEFTARDLALSAGRLEAGVQTVRVNLDLELPPSLRALSAALAAGFPESPV